MDTIVELTPKVLCRLTSKWVVGRLTSFKTQRPMRDYSFEVEEVDVAEQLDRGS